MVSSSDLQKSEVIRTALDRTNSIPPRPDSLDHYISRTIEKWRVDLEQRTPAPVYRENIGGYPVYEGTDYDIFTFLMRLSERGTVINIPDYERLDRRVFKSNQRLASNKNRHGQIIRLVSSKKEHSFSAQIKDYSVIETAPDGSETVGHPRNFAIVDYSGRMHPGWSVLEFRAIPEEMEILKRNKLQPLEGRFEFKHFVHPAMADLFYTLSYIEAKALAQRCDEEGRHYRTLEKQLRESGIKLPPSERRPPVTYESPEEPEKKVKIVRLVAKVDLPQPKGEFPILGRERDGTLIVYRRMPTRRVDLQNVLRYAIHRGDEMSFTKGMEIRGITSAVELAVFLYGFKGERALGNERLPPWINDGWRYGKRNKQLMPFSDDVVLSYRFSERTVTVRESALMNYRPGLILEHV